MPRSSSKSRRRKVSRGNSPLEQNAASSQQIVRSPVESTEPSTQLENISAKSRSLARLALFRKEPLKKDDIIKKLQLNGKTQFLQLLQESRKILRKNFGMDLVELYTRPKLSITNLNHASSNNNNMIHSGSSNVGADSNDSGTVSGYVLSTLLPLNLRKITSIIDDDDDEKRLQSGLLCIILVTIFVNEDYITDRELKAQLKKIGFDTDHKDNLTHISLGGNVMMKDLMAKWTREGYLHKYVEKSINSAELPTTVWKWGAQARALLKSEDMLGVIKEIYGGDVPEGLEELGSFKAVSSQAETS